MNAMIQVALEISYLAGRHEKDGFWADWKQFDVGEIKLMVGQRILVNIAVEASSQIYINSTFHSQSVGKALKYIKSIVENYVQSQVIETGANQ